jgi:serine/threonine-protein kinase RsbT
MTPSERSILLHVAELGDEVWCRTRAARFASEIGYGSEMQWRIAIAVSELVTNAVKFAGRGHIVVREIGEPRRGIEVVAEDTGPGISNLDAAVQDGYSEGRWLTGEPARRGQRRGLGGGLGAVRRMMDEVAFCALDGGGLRIIARKWA